MATSSLWRQRLLGSLSGQLQLATYLAVFLGFSGASIAGLWLTQRNQVVSGDADLRASARSLETCLLEDRLLEIPAGETGAARARRQQAIRQELRWHSSNRHSSGLSSPMGSCCCRRMGICRLILWWRRWRAATVTNPASPVVSASMGWIDIAILNRVYPSGQKVWSSAEVTRINQAQSAFLNWMIVIWGGCLVLRWRW